MDKVSVKCPKCGYSWETKSTSRFLTCPHCYRSIKRKKAIKEQKEE